MCNNGVGKLGTARYKAYKVKADTINADSNLRAFDERRKADAANQH
jgi:hypothetical protein